MLMLPCWCDMFCCALRRAPRHAMRHVSSRCLPPLRHWLYLLPCDVSLCYMLMPLMPLRFSSFSFDDAALYWVVCFFILLFCYADRSDWCWLFLSSISFFHYALISDYFLQSFHAFAARYAFCRRLRHFFLSSFAISLPLSFYFILMLCLRWLLLIYLMPWCWYFITAAMLISFSRLRFSFLISLHIWLLSLSPFIDWLLMHTLLPRWLRQRWCWLLIAVFAIWCHFLLIFMLMLITWCHCHFFDAFDAWFRFLMPFFISFWCRWWCFHLLMMPPPFLDYAFWWYMLSFCFLYFRHCRLPLRRLPRAMCWHFHIFAFDASSYHFIDDFRCRFHDYYWCAISAFCRCHFFSCFSPLRDDWLFYMMLIDDDDAAFFDAAIMLMLLLSLRHCHFSCCRADPLLTLLFSYHWCHADYWFSMLIFIDIFMLSLRFIIDIIYYYRCFRYFSFFAVIIFAIFMIAAFDFLLCLRWCLFCICHTEWYDIN